MTYDDIIYIDSSENHKVTVHDIEEFQTKACERKITMNDITHALRLQKLVKEKIEELTRKRKEAWYPSKQRGNLYKQSKKLQYLIKESEK